MRLKRAILHGCDARPHTNESEGVCLEAGPEGPEALAGASWVLHVSARWARHSAHSPQRSASTLARAASSPNCAEHGFLRSTFHNLLIHLTAPARSGAGW